MKQKREWAGCPAVGGKCPAERVKSPAEGLCAAPQGGGSKSRVPRTPFPRDLGQWQQWPPRFQLALLWFKNQIVQTLALCWPVQGADRAWGCAVAQAHSSSDAPGCDAHVGNACAQHVQNQAHRRGKDGSTSCWASRQPGWWINKYPPHCCCF